MPKSIDTIVKDIYGLFNEEEHHEPKPENLEALGRNIMELVKVRLSQRDKDRGALRFSNLGRPDRQLWYQHNRPELAEPMAPKTFFKFLYGDVIEQLLLFLAKEAGHDVQHEQAEIEVDGIKGHIDAIIDGVTTDSKSASPYGFKKFADKSIFENDPFGYIGQISGYANTLTPEVGGAFLVADKVHGDIGLLRIGPDTTKAFPPAPRIEHLKKVLSDPEKPARCYPDVPDGKSGNRKLGTNCSYCAFKKDCWSDANGGRGLRTFLYYGGPVFLTNVAFEPRVPEVFGEPDEQRIED
jgi:hypothetical protein